MQTDLDAYLDAYLDEYYQLQHATAEYNNKQYTVSELAAMIMAATSGR